MPRFSQGRDEETLTNSIDLVRRFKEAGLDFIDVSLGFSTQSANIPWGPAFMAPFADRVRKEAASPARRVGTSLTQTGGRALARRQARRGDDRKGDAGRSALALYRCQETECRATFMDVAGFLCPLARDISRRLASSPIVYDPLSSQRVILVHCSEGPSLNVWFQAGEKQVGTAGFGRIGAVVTIPSS